MSCSNAAREVSVRYLDLADYVAIAVEVTGLDTDTVMRVAKLDLADSALHAPAAGFRRNRVLSRLRGQDRGAGGAAPPQPSAARRQQARRGVALRLFVDINGWAWNPRLSVDDAEHAMLAIASGEWGGGEMAAWLGRYLTEPRQG